MERIGLSIILAGVLLAIGSSLPFLIGVALNVARPYDFASQLIWPGWTLGAIVSFVGLLVTAFGDPGVPQRRRAV